MDDVQVMIEQKGLNEVLEQIERMALIKAVAGYPTRASAARSLKLKRSTLIEKLKRHGLFVSREVKGYVRYESSSNE